MAIDGAGRVLVLNAFDDPAEVKQFSPDGTLLRSWGTNGTGDGQFQQPRGIAADALGNVYVADQLNHRIQKFSSSGEFLMKWGSQGSGNGQLQNPFGVATDTAGNVYVADLGNHRVQKFSSTGEFLLKWGTFGEGDGQFFNPDRVAVDRADNVYVADGSSDPRIQRFSSTHGSPASAASSAQSSPTSATSWTITVGATDDVGLASVALYVAMPGGVDYALARTQSASGTSATASFTYAPTAGDGTYKFYGRATDAAGNVEAASATPDVMIVLDTTAPTATASAPTAANGSFDVPVNYSDATSGVTDLHLYVKTPGASSFASAGTVSFSLSSTGPTSGTFTFDYSPSAGEGTYAFYATATDLAGNGGTAPTSSTAAQTNVIYDVTAPSATATSCSASSLLISVGVSYSDGRSGVTSVELLVDTPGGFLDIYSSAGTQSFSASTSGTRTFLYSPSGGDGTYKFKARATDAAGNVQPTPSSAQCTASYTSPSFGF